jgi:acetoin utilization deacetylase AcuC-like enzyme
MYPGTGMLRETGGPNAPGTNVNVPVPAGTSGDVYRRTVDEVILPVAERVAPTWLLLSTGFDAHRDDPLTDLGLSAGDYWDLTTRLLEVVPAGRRLVFLEGGYDLRAVSTATAATLAAMAGVEHRPEPVTVDPADAPGLTAVAGVRRIHELA